MNLPSSMADFVPCDRLLQKAYCVIFVAVSAVTSVEANDSAIIVAFRKRSIVVNKAFSRLTSRQICDVK